MQHAYDFYKPDMTSEYPTVDGKLSIKCYLSALDQCYALFKQKANTQNLSGDSKKFTMEHADAILFHSPYCKLIQKSVGRLLLNDYLTKPFSSSHSSYAVLEKFKNVKLTETYFDREVEQALLVASRDIYQQKTLPYLLLANQVGNMYTPSLYGGLASFISR
jgi:hydroxymethylglutaryl-CoA synthase